MPSTQFQETSGPAAANGSTHTQAAPSGTSNLPREAAAVTENKPGKPEEKEPPRDVVTGRILSEDGGSCLRCIEKGLRCTLNYFGLEGETRCAGCRRSGAKYCIRLCPLSKQVPYRGLPWKDPNFITVGEYLSGEEMEEILREHFMGQEKYTNGMYLYEYQRNGMALPPFNGADLPVGERPLNWRSINWRNVLPIWRNRSQRPRPNGPVERQNNASTPARSTTTRRAFLPPESTPGHISESTLQYLRLHRRYQAREEHVQEHIGDLGETW